MRINREHCVNIADYLLILGKKLDKILETRYKYS